MHALGGLLFLAAIIAIFLASIAFGVLSTIAAIILMGLEFAWTFVRRSVRRIKRG